MEDEQKKIKVDILEAMYYRESKILNIKVISKNGKRLNTSIPFTNIYKGQKVSDEEAHRQMEILSDLFNKSKGRSIMMVVDEEVLKQEG